MRLLPLILTVIVASKSHRAQIHHVIVAENDNYEIANLIVLASGPESLSDSPPKRPSTS